DRGPGLLGDELAQLGLAPSLLGLEGVISRAVARLVAEVADHDVVQGTDRLAEVQRIAEHALEADAGAPQVRRQCDGQPSRAPRDRTAAAIGQVHLHEAASAGGFPGGPAASGDRLSPIRGADGPRSTSRRRPRAFTEAPRMANCVGGTGTPSI